MQFSSDNWSGVADEISNSLCQHSSGSSPPYGESELDRSLEAKFNDLFETEVAVFFVGTGTAANALGLSALNRPGGFVLCHQGAHLIQHECGAPEFFTSGARLAPIEGRLGKMDPLRLQSEINRFDPDSVHHGQPMAVSVTQATEVGTVYSRDQLQQIADVTHEAGLSLHMDGARFANALVYLDISPAEMTWKSGVDVLSFGGTKNGCWCAEALVFFRPQQATELPFIRKRAAQLFSKTRFIAAQFHAYLDDHLWLDLARHANTMADRLASGVTKSRQARLAWQSESNQVFAILPQTLSETLRDKGAMFHSWPIAPEMESKVAETEDLVRLVTSFATTIDEVDRFVQLIA